MSDEAKPTSTVETLPSVEGGISALASANAPFAYFDGVPFYGLMNGIGQISLEAVRLVAAAPDNKVALDRVLVAHLRGSLEAMKALRNAINGILLMAEPIPGSHVN